MTKTNQAASGYTMGPLYDVLRKTFPDYVDRGRLDVPEFAEALGMSHEGVYKWLRANKLTPKNAKRLAEMSEGRATLKDFQKFVFA